MGSKTAGYPRFRLFTPNADKKKTSGTTSIDASRLIFQSAVFFKNRLDAKKQAGPTSLFFGTQAVKTSEFIERTLSFSGPLRRPLRPLFIGGGSFRVVHFLTTWFFIT